MIREPKAMREIHQIMEEIYEEEKDLSREEVFNRIKESAQKLIEERKLKLKRVRRVFPHRAATK